MDSGFKTLQFRYMGEWIAVILGAAAGSLATWLLDLPGKRKAQKAQSAAEGELTAIRRRGNAPYLTPSNALFNIAREPVRENGQGAGWSPINSNVLCWMRQEVPPDLPEDTPVVLIVGNSGQPARRVDVKLDNREVFFRQEPDVDGAQGLLLLKYPYQPKMRGQMQILEIAFETPDGMQDVHRYETRHGIRHLRRIDPA